MDLTPQDKELIRTPPAQDRSKYSDQDLEYLKQRAEYLLKEYRAVVQSKSDFAVLQEQSLVLMLMRGMDLV